MSLLSSKASVGALLNDNSSVAASAAPTSNVHHPSLSYSSHSINNRLRPPSPQPTLPTQVAPPPPQQTPPAGGPQAPAKKKHICPTCEKGFTTSGHLARHARVHTGERNHKCPFPGCETRCSRQDNLQQHYRIHLSPGSRRSSSSATRAAMNRAMEMAQSNATQSQGSHSQSASPELHSPHHQSGPTLTAPPLPSMPPPDSTAINPLNSSMVGGGGGASGPSTNSSPSSNTSGGTGFVPSPEVRRSNTGPGSLLQSASTASSNTFVHSSNALGLHSVPNPLSGGNHLYPQSDRLSLSYSSQPPPQSQPPQSQSQSYFYPIRPPYQQQSASYSASSSNPNSTHTTPHLSSTGMTSSNSPVSPAASISTVSSPTGHYAPMHSIPHHNQHHQHQNQHMQSHHSLQQTHNTHHSFGPSDSPPPRLPPIHTHQPYQQLSYHHPPPPPIPRSHSSHPYYASPYTPAPTYPPVSVSLGMASAGMGPSWKDGLAMHVGNGSALGMSAVGHSYHGDGGEYRRR